MALTRATKDRLVRATNDAFTRADALYSRIALNGGYHNATNYAPLMNPDRRDAATFIFFEVAAQYESFCSKAFEIEVRKSIRLDRKMR